MADSLTALSPSDWWLVLDALQAAADEVEYDLHDTRNSHPWEEERDERLQRVKEWRRISGLIATLATAKGG